MLIRSLLLTLLAIALAACCPCQQPPKIITSLPAPVTLAEQTRRLAEWSAKLPNIRARTVITGVRLDYRDDKGQDKSVNAEGLLQIQQHVAESAAPPAIRTPADVLLLGSSFDQPAFEAGRNAKDWWFAIRLDTKKAWVGDSTKPVNLTTLGKDGSTSVLRADLVPDLLGLTDLPPAYPMRTGAAGSAASDVSLLIVDDDAGINRLIIVNSQRPNFIAREIFVDRHSGHITEVRMYDPNGILAVRSQLSDYVNVTYGAGTEKPATLPQFPRKVTVTYPTQHLTVALEFDTITVVKDFKPIIFETPDFKEEGLRVIPTE